MASLGLWLPPTVLSVLLVAIAQFSFPAFHTLVELFAIIISFVLFAVAWSTRRLSSDSFLLFLACGYFWVGAIDGLHMLVYKGMNVLVAGSGNLSVQFWLSARFIEAPLLLVAPFLASRRLNEFLLTALFGGIALAFSLSIFLGHFPTGFVEGTGLTPFKIYSEYVIILVLILALFALNRRGSKVPAADRTLINGSIILTMGAELAFTVYVDVFDLSNLAGHILKLFSFWFIYRAIIISSLEQPYALLRRNEKDLRSALVAAHRASKAKSEFLANMSHELRTPLNAIIGFAQMLQAETFGPLGSGKNKEYVEIINSSGGHLHRLISDILDLSKIEAGEARMSEEAVDVADVVGQTMVMMSDHGARKGLSLVSDVPPELPRLQADRLKVMQVLLNLLSNAIKFTPRGGKVSVSAGLDRHGAVVLKVRDSGVGIAAEDLERIFEPFSQIASSYTSSQEGTGLGLALVRSLLRLHGATVQIESEPGAGTEVVVSFPPERTIVPQEAGSGSAGALRDDPPPVPGYAPPGIAGATRPIP